MEKIKSRIMNNIGKNVIITTDIDKKKCSSFKCVIKEVYRSIFVVELPEAKYDNLRTFSYSDVYAKQILIEVCE